MQELESERRKRVCAGVSFAIFVGLFCRVCRSLLSCMLVSFIMFVGLFCRVCRSLLRLEHLQSVDAEVGKCELQKSMCRCIFCHLCWSLLSCLLVTFVVYVGLFCHGETSRVWMQESESVSCRRMDGRITRERDVVEIVTCRGKSLFKETYIYRKRDPHK